MSESKGWIGWKFVIPTGPDTSEEVTCHAMIGDKGLVILKDGTRLLVETFHGRTIFRRERDLPHWSEHPDIERFA